MQKSSIEPTPPYPANKNNLLTGWGFSYEIRSPEIIMAVRRVGAGQPHLDPKVTTVVLERVRRSIDNDPIAQLSDQERRVLDSIAECKTNWEIADEVHLSDKTVKNYVSNILRKLAASRKFQAAVFWVELRAMRGYSE